MEEVWTPAIIADRGTVLKFHKIDPGQVTKYAGKKIRVRLNDDCQTQYGYWAFRILGCKGIHIEVHPDDARKLWPEIREKVTICNCQILSD